MLREGNCVKLFTGATSGDLEAYAGESLIIKRIECFQDDGDTYLTAKTDRVTVGFYRVQGKSAGHINTTQADVLKFNIMEFLNKQGVNVSLPVAEGQTFSWTTTAAVNAVMIIYDRYDAGDILNTAPNGSEAKQYVFMQYMNIGTPLTVSGDALFDVSLSPSEFPDFPCGKVVPPRYTITLLGLIGCPWCDGQDTEIGFYTTHIKLIKDRKTLFDRDRNGLPFKAARISADTTRYGADYTVIGAGKMTFNQAQDPAGEPLMFDPPLVFNAGDELNIYAVCTAFGVAPGWTITVPDLAAILKVQKT